MFILFSCSVAFHFLLCFCAGSSRPTSKRDRDQKHITKTLAEFHNQFVLVTTVQVK